ncbi:hypothetical protein NG791_20375 [Laspinema sp. D1]|uniref:hypothetical protein n=1 Tax=Laspinema palackyanum TaxID=3231601 RepID=UPI003497A29B|nr:hypothetical protein [Laspinema sp. D2b]
MGEIEGSYISRFFTLNCTSGPLPLARGGLGWGSSALAIATSPTLNGLSACMEAGENLFLRDVRSPPHEDPLHSAIPLDALKPIKRTPP